MSPIGIFKFNNFNRTFNVDNNTNQQTNISQNNETNRYY